MGFFSRLLGLEERSSTRVGGEGQCPRCTAQALARDAGVVHEDVCPRCQGRFLPPAAVEQLVIGELGVERSLLRELTEHPTGAPVSCSGCTARCFPVLLRGVSVCLCRSCGGVWCDAGGLATLSEGRHREVSVLANEVTRAALKPKRPARFAVLERDPPFADGDQMRRAFAALPGLTDADARRVGRLSAGVVAEGLDEKERDDLCEALAGLGVVAVGVAVEALRLPRPREVISVRVTDKGLDVPSHYGGRSTVPWDDVTALAVGGIKRVEEAVRHVEVREHSSWITHEHEYRRTEVVHSTDIAASADSWLEVLLKTDKRLRLRASRVGLDAYGEGSRPTRFRRLVDDVVSHLPTVPMAPGAERDGWRLYENPDEMQHALAWTRWRQTIDDEAG